MKKKFELIVFQGVYDDFPYVEVYVNDDMVIAMIRREERLEVTVFSPEEPTSVLTEAFRLGIERYMPDLWKDLRDTFGSDSD
jgi:hypothetical protein